MSKLRTALRLLADAIFLTALAGAAWWLWITFRARVGYGFDLEWMEGGMLVHALRVSQGQSIYVEPTPQFIPYIYPPLYAWVVGWLGRLLEVSYALGRSVSFAGTCLGAGLLVLVVRQEGYRWSLGLGAAALFLSCYEDSGAFFDLVRSDGLLIALLAGSLLLCRRATPAGLCAGGLLLVLAFLTKHSFAILGLPIALTLWRAHGWRRAAFFVAWSAVPALLAVIALQLATDGFFLTYLLGVPASHPIVAERAFPGCEKELALAFPWALSAASLAVLLLLRHHRPPALYWSASLLTGMVATAVLFVFFKVRADDQLPLAVSWTSGGAALAALLLARQRSFPLLYWSATGGTGLALVILMRGHHGGFLNVLIPGFWLLALATALALGQATRRWKSPWLLLACAALLAGQTWLERWSPQKYQPTAADVAAGERTLETIAAYDGPVLMPHSPYYPVLVGKEPSFSLIALWDITHKFSPLKDEARCVNRALAAERYDAVILASAKFKYGLEKNYRNVRTLRYKGRTFFPKTGWRARPRYVFEPKKKRAPAPAEENEPTPEEPEETEPQPAPEGSEH